MIFQETVRGSSSPTPQYHGKTPFGDVLIRRPEYKTVVNGVKMVYRPNRDNWATVMSDGTITAHDKQPSTNIVSQDVWWDVHLIEDNFKRHAAEETTRQGRLRKVEEIVKSTLETLDDVPTSFSPVCDEEISNKLGSLLMDVRM